MEDVNLQALFYQYRDKVFGFFIKGLGDRELAEDLTQDLFLKLCKNEEGLCSVENINSYIYWMAQNMVIDHLRKAAHRKDYRESLIAAWKENRPENRQVPEIEEIIDQEHYDELFNRIIRDLTPQQQVIVTLSKKEGLSNKRIAQKLGLSPHTVKNHLHQALKTLRTQVDLNAEFIVLFLYYGLFLSFF